jgi:hypothetical protein
VQIARAIGVGLTLVNLACSSQPVPTPDAGGTSTGGSGGTSTPSTGAGSSGTTSSGGSTTGSNSSSGGGAAILAGTLGFTAVFEGEYNRHFADGGFDPGSLVVFFSDFDFSPYCAPNPDGGNIYLPNPVGAAIAIVTLEGDGGSLDPETYSITPDDATAVLQGAAAGAVVTEGLANQPYNFATSGSVTLQAVFEANGGTLAAGYFHASLVDPDGGLAGSLSGSFPANACPGAGYWQ